LRSLNSIAGGKFPFKDTPDSTSQQFIPRQLRFIDEFFGITASMPGLFQTPSTFSISGLPDEIQRSDWCFYARLILRIPTHAVKNVKALRIANMIHAPVLPEETFPIEEYVSKASENRRNVIGSKNNARKQLSNPNNLFMEYECKSATGCFSAGSEKE